MSFADDIAGALDALHDDSPCTVTHGENEYQAVKAFDVGDSDMMQLGGYVEQQPDARVLIKLKDISPPGIKPRDELLVDGVRYRVTNNGVRRNTAFLQLDLSLLT